MNTTQGGREKLSERYIVQKSKRIMVKFSQIILPPNDLYNLSNTCVLFVL